MPSKGAYKLYSDARTRARNKGLEFDLQPKDVILCKYCPVLGIPLRHSSKRRTSNSYSLDRIDNTRGYSKDNILVISWRANFLKGDANLKELEKLVKFYKRLKNGKANTRRRPKSLLPTLEKANVKGLSDVSTLDLSKGRKPSNRRKRRLVAMQPSFVTLPSNRDKQKCKRGTSGNRVNEKRVSKIKRTTRGHSRSYRTKQASKLH